MIVTLPYPPAKLSPNGTRNRFERVRLTKEYRASCGFELLAQGVSQMTSVALEVTFCPPNRRRRDRDNAIAAFKAGMDSIADITGIDDSQFQVTYTPGFGEPRKGGCVIVELSQ